MIGSSETGSHPSSDELLEVNVEVELKSALVFDAPLDKTERIMSDNGIKLFLKALKRNPNIATVHAYNDFRYTAKNSLSIPLIEREYWLKMSGETLPELMGKDGFIILHIHYSGEWRDSDTLAVFNKKRSIITQINGRHTWDDSCHISDRFFKKCWDLDKWREARGTEILGNHEAPNGWRWRDGSQRNLTVDTSCLRDLLEKGEKCRKVVRTKYVDLVTANIEASDECPKNVPHPPAAGAGSCSTEQCIAWAPAQNWGELPEPVLPAPPYRILFVGANNVDSSQLCVDTEKREMKLAFMSKFGNEKWGDNVIFQHSCFASTGDLASDLLEHDPIILHFACHAHESALSLFEQDLAAKDLEKLVALWTASDKRLRVIIANACNSDHIAQALSKHVDFVIGHATRVYDEDAVHFARVFYGYLGAGESLEMAFNAAKMVSNPYCMAGQKNAMTFKLTLPTTSSASANAGVKLLATAAANSQINATDSTTPCMDPDEHDKKELIDFLKSEGLGRIAQKICDKLEMERKDDLADVTRRDADGLHLQDWQQVRFFKCIEYVKMSVAGSATLRNGDLEDGGLSGADTASEGADISSESLDDDCDYEVVVAKHPGDPKDFQKHIQDLIRDFLDNLWVFEDSIVEGTESFFLPARPQGTWTFCMLVWMRFVKDATFDERSQEEWLRCISSANQDKLLAILDSCLECQGTIHTLWVRARFKRLDCSKEFAAAIFVTDNMVRHALSRHPESERIWERYIVKGWFENSESASAFLLRANNFLRTEFVNGISIVQTVVKTQSYVAFMRMPKLVSLLLFEHLEVCKLENASTAGAARGSNALSHGFCMFVSSSHRVFSLQDADAPACHAQPIVMQGLQCLARLPAPAFEMMGPVRTLRESLKFQPKSAEVELFEMNSKAKYPCELIDDWHGACMEILNKLFESPIAGPFVGSAHLEETELGDYAKIVQEPMDFRIIKEKLASRQYGAFGELHAEAFHRDITKVFKNAMLYYNEGHEIHQQAAILQEFFDKLWSDFKDTVKIKDKGSSERQQKLDNILGDDISQGSFHSYITQLKKEVVFFEDSATGQRRGIDGQSISLMLFSSKSFVDKIAEDIDATQEDLICPISLQIMQDPVECSDGKTYERTAIERWFRERPRKASGGLSVCISPLTNIPLKCENEDGTRLKFTENKDVLSKIRKFKQKRNLEEETRKRDAEGEEDTSILRQRLGITGRSSEMDSGQKNEGQQIDSADKLLEYMMTEDPGAHQVCLIGPPACGKTVTILQIVYAAVKKCKMKTPQGQWGLVPVFMRAAELSALLLKDNTLQLELETLLVERDQKTCSLRQLLLVFLANRYPQDVVKVMTELFDLSQLLICLDGLDEASHRELIERSIDQAVRVTTSGCTGTPLRVLLSTREHSYSNSRACLRLGDFGVVKLQPLDESRQLDMIERRIPAKSIDRFKQQLSTTARQNPELSTSPFLLSLMIEVYNQHNTIPTQRVELYAQQVEGIVLRCIKSRVERGETSFVPTFQGSTFEKSEMKEASMLATEYLETLSFVCQMQREERDFKLATCMTSMEMLWERDVAFLAEIRDLLFKDPVVGLLSGVGINEYRFSHLTLQEYLAARCGVRLYEHNVEELVKNLMPLHSRWRREVLQFTACLLKENFVQFCKTVLQWDNGAGANCELVRAFLKERGESAESEQVEQMVRDKLLEIRGASNLIAGLCHPSPELRDLLLSEMRQFKMPSDPFSDGTIAKLKNIAEDITCFWHTRRAAILSIAQVAQMRYCSQGRAGALRWMLKMFDAKPEVVKDIHFALIKGLGTLLQGSDLDDTQLEDCLVLKKEDDNVFIRTLEQAENLAVAEAIADLAIFSDRLVDWILSKSHLISDGKWPLRHILLICKKTELSHNVSSDGRGLKIVAALVGRVHLLDFNILERGTLIECLCTILPALSLGCQLDLQTLMQCGNVDQRIRVLRVVEEVKIPFDFSSFENLGLDQQNESILLEVMAELNMISDRLVDWFLNKPRLVVESGWPMRNVLCICNVLHTYGSLEWAHSQLAQNVLIRLHSTSFQPSERAETIEALAILQAIYDDFSLWSTRKHLPVLQFLETGDVDQRTRVFLASGEAGLTFGMPLHSNLAKCLLKMVQTVPQKPPLEFSGRVSGKVKVDVNGKRYSQRVMRLLQHDQKYLDMKHSDKRLTQQIEEFRKLLEQSPELDSAKEPPKTTLCSKFESGHCKFGDLCHRAHGRHEQICKNWITGTCTYGTSCLFQHGTLETLLALILKEERAQEEDAPTTTTARYSERSRSWKTVTVTGRADANGAVPVKFEGFEDVVLIPSHRLRGALRDPTISISNYLLDVLRPSANDETVQQVFKVLLNQQINEETGAVSSITIQTVSPSSQDQKLHVLRRSAKGDGVESVQQAFARSGSHSGTVISRKDQLSLEQNDALPDRFRANIRLDDSLDAEHLSRQQPPAKSEEANQLETGVSCIGIIADKFIAGYSKAATVFETMRRDNVGVRSIRAPVASFRTLMVMKKIQQFKLHELESQIAATFRTESLSTYCVGDGQEAYICATLWERSDLVTDLFVRENEQSLTVKVALDEAKRAFIALCHLEDPWFQGTDRHSIWSHQVFEAIKLKTLGRMLFPVILEYIRLQFKRDPVSAAKRMVTFAGHLEAWTTDNELEQLERQLLLKELFIGRRVMDLPVWAGHISTPDLGHQRNLSSNAERKEREREREREGERMRDREAKRERERERDERETREREERERQRERQRERDFDQGCTHKGSGTFWN